MKEHRENIAFFKTHLRTEANFICTIKCSNNKAKVPLFVLLRPLTSLLLTCITVGLCLTKRNQNYYFVCVCVCVCVCVYGSGD
jgi:L-asparagine transporter-like permease